jgi:ATP-dependent protease HslVU (ClpYQ) peptidase subunit
LLAEVVALEHATKEEDRSLNTKALSIANWICVYGLGAGFTVTTQPLA